MILFPLRMTIGSVFSFYDLRDNNNGSDIVSLPKSRCGSLLSLFLYRVTIFVIAKFFNKYSWQIKDEEVIAFVEQHKDMLAAIMTSYLKQQLEAYTFSGFRKYVLEHTQPGTYEEIEGRVRTSHQKRIDGYVAQLEELGYDKDGNPIEKEAQ